MDRSLLWITRLLQLWNDVRAAQSQRMIDFRPMPHEPVNRLVSFYSYMMHKLAVLGARLQGFRFELTTNRVFGEVDPVRVLSDNVFSALELLMSDCVLATEPSTNPILVTNNLFSINCGALARGVVFREFEVQVVTEEAAEHIQVPPTKMAVNHPFAFSRKCDVRRCSSSRRRSGPFPRPLFLVSSFLLLSFNHSSVSSNETDEWNEAIEFDDHELRRCVFRSFGGDIHSLFEHYCWCLELISDAQSSSKKSDVNSKEHVKIYPAFNAKNRYWNANYSQLLCTTRQKGRQSTNSSFQVRRSGVYSI